MRLYIVDTEPVTEEDLAALEAARPKTRADCIGGLRPCPFAGCRYHLYLDVRASGELTINSRVPPEEMTETCALDVADRGGCTLEEVGSTLAVTRERIRQIEDVVIRLVRRRGIRGDATVRELAILSDVTPLDERGLPRCAT